MKNFNNRYLCKNIHRYFTDISDISDISVKSNYRYIRVYRYFDPWLNGRGHVHQYVHESDTDVTCELQNNSIYSITEDSGDASDVSEK